VILIIYDLYAVRANQTTKTAREQKNFLPSSSPAFFIPLLLLFVYIIAIVEFELEVQIFYSRIT
jgi:hypothetical protein